MTRVFVLSNTREELAPCSPARARELLKKRKAAVFRRYPFTIILNHRNEGDVQDVELKVDPGSKTTGIALVSKCKRGNKVIFAANLEHKGEKIRSGLDSRRAIRRSRRSRKTRYRAPRFNNRKRSENWLPPSLRSRVNNIVSFVKRLTKICPVTSIELETVKFDMQKIENPEISGREYQQGTLYGYELREYMLEKWNRKCSYCSKSDVPLEIEHIIPKSRGGSNRASNLTLACVECNQAKGNQSIESFLAKDPKKLRNILKNRKVPLKVPLKDAAAVNATRYAIRDSLKKLGLPISFWSGGQTKYNRMQQKLSKDHWIDAACIGPSGKDIYIPQGLSCLTIKAEGRGSRQMCRVDRYGFPRTTAKKARQVLGFKTGDIVKAIVTKGKKLGTYFGKVAIRSSGYFNIVSQGDVVQGIHARYCQILHKSDGYNYIYRKNYLEAALPPAAKAAGFRADIG